MGLSYLKPGIQAQLTRLNTSYIDVYSLHHAEFAHVSRDQEFNYEKFRNSKDPSRTDLGKTWGYLIELREKGVFKGLGMSNMRSHTR